MTIEIEYFDDIGKLQADPRAAPALSQARTPFDRPEWWSLLVRHCGLSPWVLQCGDGDARMIWPLAREGSTARSLANFYSFSSSPLVTEAHEYAPFLEPAARDLRGRFSRLVLDRVPCENGETAAICDALERAGWSVACEQDDTNHYLDLRGRDFETYLAQRPGRLRTTLERRTRKLETEVLEVASDEHWRIYEQIYAASWKPEEASQAFWREFCTQEAEAGRLRFGLAFAGDKPVAAQIWTVEGGTAFIHKLAHLPEAERLSPGSVLTAALMRHVIEQDAVATVDFGTGDDRYKRDWMEAARPRYRIDARDPRDWRNWPALAKRTIKARLAGAEKDGYRPANAADGALMATSHVPENALETGTDDPVDAKLRQVLVDILALDEGRVAAFDARTGLFGHVPELDSQAVATLLTEVEDRFAIVIDDEDVDSDMLETYGGLRAFVQAKCAAAA